MDADNNENFNLGLMLHMPKHLILITASLLTAWMAISTAVPTASGLDHCLPNACCHAGSGERPADAMNHATAASGCHGRSEPCCEVQPSLPFPVMALQATSEIPHKKMTDIIGAIDSSAPVIYETYYPTAHYKRGHLKIPQPPIYLQIQSFLC